MLLSRIVECSREVGETRSRKKKIAALAACLGAMSPPEIEIGVSFLSGCLPRGRIGLGYAAVRSIDAPAASAPRLELAQVDETLAAIAALSGAGAKHERHRLFGALLARATESEQGFLARLVVGEVRQGALEGVVVEAIAVAAGVSPGLVRRAVMLRGALAPVARAALCEGEAALMGFALEVGRPVQPMLAQTCDGAAEAIDQLGEALLDYKLDGARIQVHKDGDEVRVFSRKLRSVSQAVPEVVELVRALAAKRVVLDGEVLALREDGTPHDFQTTMRRFGRKRDVAAQRARLPLSAFFFDCLHLDGEDLMDASTRERLAAMTGVLPADAVIPREITADPQRAEGFLEEALARGHEGLMAKSLQTPYEAGSRGAGWLKVKPAHTLDLVVLAAEWGSGRRRGWLSNLHLGARNPDGSFTMLGKTFKGMSDSMLAWQTKRLTELELGRDGHTVFVRPELVVEIAVSDVQTSPHYPGGLALRFARVKRYREDKRPVEADTLETVQGIHAGITHRRRRMA